jgi:hypothetical protein
MTAAGKDCGAIEARLRLGTPLTRSEGTTARRHVMMENA